MLYRKAAKRVRKLRTALLLTILLLALLIPDSFAAEGAGLRANWTATSAGSMSCEMTFTYNFPIPQDSLTIHLPEGAERISVLNYSHTRSGSAITIKAGGYFTGEQSFQISYSLPGAVTKDEEGVQHLRLPLVPKDFGLAVRYVEYSLALPQRYDNEPVLTLDGERLEEPGFTLDKSSLSGSKFVTVSGEQELDLELDLGAGYFTTRPNHLKRLFASWRLLLVFLLAAAILYWYLFFFRNARRPRAVRRAMAPDASIAADLPCLLYGGNADAAALMLEWASLGYVALERDKKGRWTAHPQIRMGSERREAERAIFERFFENGSLRLGTERWARLSAAAGRKLQAGWIRRLFDPKSGSPKLLQILCVLYGALCLLSGTQSFGIALAIISLPVGALLAYLFQRGVLSYLRRADRTQILVGAAAGVLMLVLLFVLSDPLMLLAILVQVLCALGICFGGRRSADGAELLDQTLGLRRYLTGLKPKQAASALRRDSQYLYRMLPYATALGSQKAFLDHFKDLDPEPCDWLESIDLESFRSLYEELLGKLRAVPRKRK